MPCVVENHSLLVVHAFIARFPQPVLATNTAATTLTLLTEPTSVAPLPAPDASLRATLRDALRKGAFKPTGRSKPSSEYLWRAREEAALRSINVAVDIGNAVSLHSGLPISVIDIERVTPPLRIQNGAPGESYVFNPAGQVLALAGLPCLYDADGPCANAVKDAQRSKTSETTTVTLSLIWSCRGLESITDAALNFYKSLLSEVAVLEPVELRHLANNSA
ncbi:MAG: hypothetical protein RL701_5163 [Pseudomonadota bacterium]|jgi:DNA/RNA-binding domain of Phe-tRNA-synthetase-like protein